MMIYDFPLLLVFFFPFCFYSSLQVDDIIHLVENSISLRMIDVTGSRVRRTSDRRPDLRVKGLDKLRWDDDETFVSCSMNSAPILILAIFSSSFMYFFFFFVCVCYFSCTLRLSSPAVNLAAPLFA